MCSQTSLYLHVRKTTMAIVAIAIKTKRYPKGHPLLKLDKFCVNQPLHVDVEMAQNALDFRIYQAG